MALWHDPLDELIDELERSLPAQQESGIRDYQQELVALQMLVSSIMNSAVLTLVPEGDDDASGACESGCAELKDDDTRMRR